MNLLNLLKNKNKMQSLEIKLENAQGVLTRNEDFVNKYKGAFESKTTGLSEVLTEEQDEDIMKFIVSAKTCVKKMNEDRSVYTRRMDEVKSMFTAQEAVLSDIIKQSQKLRDNSATIQLNKKSKTEEVPLLREKIEVYVKNTFVLELGKDIEDLQSCLLNPSDVLIEELSALEPNYTQNRFDQIIESIPVTSLYGNDVGSIIANVIEGKFEPLRDYYIKKMSEAIEATIHALAGKEVSPKEVAVPEPIVAKEVTQPIVKEKGKRTSLELEVINKEGWLQVVQMYFRDVEDLDGKVTLEKMRKHAEQVANKTGEVLEAGVTYKEVVKTSARVACK